MLNSYSIENVGIIDISLFLSQDSDKIMFSNQQSFELNPLPPPPLTDDNEAIVVNVTIPLNTDTDFLNFQLGESSVRFGCQ